ncbi:iron ABC transporter permease [Frigidibacter sp. SD6-1]|uniref:ABC transporter permease n=1 Tax=Frigidibacter sp. SD6-1 TaxID=3032581 RepID=UPI0024DF6692|nr:iron ABC transporter permease [Frigidibacter sp. SD6-1]
MRAHLQDFRRSPVQAVLFLVVLWLAASFIYGPIWSVLRFAFAPEGKPGLGAAAELAASRRVITAIWNTLVVTGLSIITVNVVGLFQVAVLEYLKVPGRGFLRFAYSTPLIFVSVAAATGYGFVYGPTGALTRIIQSIYPALPNDWFSGTFAVVFAHSFLLTSFHFLFLRAAIRRVDYATVEAARSLGASNMRAFLQVVLPVLLPTIFATTLLVTYKSLGSFSIPAVLGGQRFDMVSELILTLNSLRRPDMAAMLSIGLGAAVILCIVAMQYIERRGSFIGGAKTPVPIERVRIASPPMRTLVTGLAYLVALIQLVPIVLVVLFSFAPARSIGTEVLPSTLTLKNYVTVFSQDTAFVPLRNSILMALAAIAAGILISLFVVAMAQRVKGAVSNALDLTFMIPWILPAPFVAIGLILTYDEPSQLVFGATLLGGFWILPIGYAIVAIPMMIRFLRAAFLSLDPALNEAAQSLGAPAYYRFFRVTLPIVLPVIVLVSGMTLNSLMSEYSMSAFLFNVNNKPLSIALFEGARSTNPELAAINMVYIVLIMAFSLLTITLADRYGLGNGQEKR